MIEEMQVELTREWKGWEYCGTKAAELFILEAMNIPIPKFYVIPVSYFQQFCDKIQAISLSEFYNLPIYNCDTYENSFHGHKVCILSNELVDISGKFIIRSSAVPQEGMQIGDFASRISGVFESFIANNFNMVGEMVLKVWRSVYSKDAYDKLYAFRRGFGVRGMSVVVQQYMEPVISGVVHVYSNKINVNWIEGSQEEVLQGRQYGQEIEVYLSDDGETILRGKESSVRNVVESLWKTVFRELYDWCMKIWNIKSFNQEIEWVYDGESVWIVQVQKLL